MLLLFATIPIFSQNTSALSKDTLDYYEMSLEDLLKLKAHGVPSELEALINSLISVSSKKAINTREAPGIISLITEDDIKNSGARDLIDVLRMIPGIDFGVDIEGVVGLGMRGNWANEGKILILLDGQETNEILYASSQLGNRFPVDLIKRIEIIRGPGSAIYGGYAEYGVINIITKQAEDINGVYASATYGHMQKDFGRKNISLAIGKKIKDFSFNASGFIGRAQRSDQVYTDYQGKSFDMRNNSDLNTNHFNFGTTYKNFSFKLIADEYQIQSRDGYGNVLEEGSVKNSFTNLYAELKHETKLSQKWKLTSKLNFKNQKPWETNGYAGTGPFLKKAMRNILNITAAYDYSRNFNVTFGTESYYDFAKDLTEGSVFNNNKNTINYFNYSMFVQSLLKTKITNIILGARFDHHSAFGGAFVPRIGLTKKINKFHYKVLFGRSFRAPSIENINDADSTGIKPEFTNVAECELGYQINKNSIFSFNVFDITTTQPIVFYTAFDSTNEEYYKNFGASGSQGVEAEYRYKSKVGQIGMNYAFYSSANKSIITTYQTITDKSLLGFANHRINLFSQINFNKYFSGNISASYYSKRYRISGYDAAGNTMLTQDDPIFLLNCFFQYKLTKSGLNFGLGVFDLLNQRYSFIQPYDGGHAGLPGPSREITIKIQYNFRFKNTEK